MAGGVLGIFISYSRTDSTFVDQLEASLRSRNYRTWVDRTKLEGGQNWLDEIQAAIDDCDLLLAIVSPEAVASEYVRMEYRYARQNGKLVIPVLYRATSRVPIDLSGIQYVDFQSIYDRGFRDLLVALSRVGIPELAPPIQTPEPPPIPVGAAEPDFVEPEPPPPVLDPDLNALYRAGLKAKTEQNLERATVLWQQILDRSPNFGNGLVANQVNKLHQELHPIRVRGLRQQAEVAHRAGKWGEEIGAWKALLALGDDIQAWERLPIAARNKQCSWLYENALHFANEKEYNLAKTQLKELWQHAPYYGDPEGIAGIVGIQIPPNIQEVLDSRAKAEVREARSQERVAFIKDDLGMDAFLVQVCSFCLISGLGAAVGIITQSFLWVLGVSAFIALLSYILGYVRAIALIDMGVIFILSTLLALGLTWPTLTLRYVQPQISQQIVFGAIIGSLSLIGVGVVTLAGLMDKLFDFLDSRLLTGLVVTGILAALMVIMGFFGSQFAWGFGFNPIWYLYVIAWFVTCISEVGVFFSAKISNKALR